MVPWFCCLSSHAAPLDVVGVEVDECRTQAPEEFLRPKEVFEGARGDEVLVQPSGPVMPKFSPGAQPDADPHDFAGDLAFEDAVRPAAKQRAGMRKTTITAMSFHGVELGDEDRRRLSSAGDIDEGERENADDPLAHVGQDLPRTSKTSTSQATTSEATGSAKSAASPTRPFGGRVSGWGVKLKGASSSASLGSDATSSRTSVTSGGTKFMRFKRGFSKAMLGSASASAFAGEKLAPPPKPNFHGSWECTGTWGLDDFLRENGISRLQRMAAAKAPWPTWEFQQSGDTFVFINHSFLGDIKEDFVVNGQQYTAVDGKKQELQCTAVWEGQKLVIERSGPQGRFREEREIDGQGRLQFTLRGLDGNAGGEDAGTSWGRTFAKK